MLTRSFFDSTLEFLEVSEHFALLPHWIEPRVSGEVIDEDYVISTSAECRRLGRSPYIGVNDVEYAFARVPLLRKWLPMLLAELARLTYAFGLSLFEDWESDDDSFRLHCLKLLKVDVANPLVP